MYISESKKTAYQMMGMVVILLLLYAASLVFTALKFLPDDPLVFALSYMQVSGGEHILLTLAIVTGLIAGGIYMVADRYTDGNLQYPGLLRIAYSGWVGFLVLSVASVILGQIEGRTFLELPIILDVIEVILILFFVGLVVMSAPQKSATVVVWGIGLCIKVAATVISLLPASDGIQHYAYSALAVNLKFQLAYLLAALSLGFWLIRRFSRVSQQWADEGLYTTAGLLSFAGSLVCIAPLYVFGTSNPGIVPVLVIPVLVLMFAARSYRALSDRNPTFTLATHWYAFSVILLIFALGILGALQTFPGIQAISRGTQLTHLQIDLMTYVVLAVLLGTINQIGAELRGENRRITGYVPFWLIVFGWTLVALALFGIGIVQIYLERQLGVGYLDVQELALPLYLIWIIGVLLVAFGIGTYAIGFRARRPQLSDS